MIVTGTLPTVMVVSATGFPENVIDCDSPLDAAESDATRLIAAALAIALPEALLGGETKSSTAYDPPTLVPLINKSPDCIAEIAPETRVSSEKSRELVIIETGSGLAVLLRLSIKLSEKTKPFDPINLSKVTVPSASSRTGLRLMV